MDEVNFKINDKRYTVGCEVSSDVTLLDYIRETAELRGTKYMCREGGCGACIVSAIISPERPPVAVNSCLVSVTSCEGWNITTIEKVGNQLDGYSPLQTTLAEENGTQCGYCSPGWIMSMYSLQKSNKDLSMLEIEKSFGSNICRCTGYRPILEAFKKFAKDNPSPKLKDIEDLASCKGTKGKCVKQKCSEDVDWCFVNYNDVAENSTIEIELCDRKKWFRVQTINAVFDLLFKEGDDSYMLVAGNTAKGVYPIFEYPRILIDITAVSELKGHTLDQNLIIGAGMTITETMNIFKNKSKEDNFSYLQKLYDHLSHVAHIPVRNIGTLGGNLMIKHQHNAFPSDIYVLLECVGAQLTIQSSRTVKLMVNMQQFLNLNMRGKVIRNILLPPLNSEYNIVTFKVMPRSQNAKSIVNAGFLFKLNKESKILDSRIVYGGLSPYYNRSLFAERYLIGKYLFSNATLKAAIDKLQNELVVTENPPDASVEYRKQLAINLFYKGVLTLCPPNLLNARYRSGANKIHDLRLVSEGRQIYDTNRSLWPLNQPVQKLEALIQCSGEAAYTEDIPALPNEVFAAFALSTVASGTIININYSKALKTPGVIAFYSAKDIPGLNSFTPAGTPFYVTNEEILCSGEIKYCNQPIGIIVAKTRALAERAAKLVSAEYKDSKKIVIDIKEAKKVSERNTLLSSSDATKKGTDVARVIEGDQTIYAQYHSMLETLVSISIPKEGDCLDVHAATQYLDAVQMMTARALNMPQNCIDVHVLRLGGAYGIKISRVSQVAIACSLVAKKLNRPCRFIQSLTTNMKAVGKRFPCSTNFKVAVNSSGVIQYNNYDLFEDNGFLVNEPLSSFGVDVYYNCYKNDTWNYKCYNTLTDTAKNTFCRSPGTMESIVMAESLMERIGYELSMDPLEVRVANLNETKFGALKEMVENLKSNASYVERRAYVNKFNDENRWTKRGIRFSLSRWSPVGSQYFNLILSVYHGDGTVTISHGGIEMGQGVNTKAAQICAYFLNISLDKIKVKCSNTIKSPNSFASGGSLTSTNVGICAQRASEKLLERLKPVKEQMDNPTWEELIEKAFGMGINLQTCGFINDKDVQNYNIYGVALAEVEVDILTGETEIIRVDLIQDVGQSVSPGIDIGQIEGAFIMGLGYWTSEELVYDKTTGEVLTDRTWTYHVPLARDIPLDFRVYFRKNSYSNQIMLGSKATGEPPICLSVVITFAIRAALAAARLDKGLPPWFQLGLLLLV